MDFEQAERTRHYAELIERFMSERIVPNERTYVER